jgi:type VI protein secretion system component Hcp
MVTLKRRGAAMSQSDKPTSKKPNAQRTDQPLPEAELDQVSGGKVSTSDITITKHYDKSSPSLG